MTFTSSSLLKRSASISEQPEFPNESLVSDPVNAPQEVAKVTWTEEKRREFEQKVAKETKTD
jgi:hypothetical protein